MLRVKKLLNFLIAMSKRCTKCGEVKPLSAFNKQKMGLYGVTSRCKMCLKEYIRIHKEKNKEHYKEKGKQWRENNKEYIKQYQIDNKEHIKEYSKQYSLNNKEHIKQYQKQYNKQYRLNNKEHNKEYSKQYNLNNKEHINKRRKEQIKNLTDTYIVGLITNRSSLTSEDIEQYNNMIEAKKEYLKLKRLIKQLSK